MFTEEEFNALLDMILIKQSKYAYLNNRHKHEELENIKQKLIMLQANQMQANQVFHIVNIPNMNNMNIDEQHIK